MWGKTTDRATELLDPSRHFPERVPMPAPPPPKVAAMVGKSMRLHGDLYSEDELFMDGEFEGALEVRNKLTIGPNGKVKANVKARELVVKGWIQGNVEAMDRITIMNGATILGDVKTAGIVIEDGAYFKGGIDILCPDTKPELKAHAATV